MYNSFDCIDLFYAQQSSKFHFDSAFTRRKGWVVFFLVQVQHGGGGWSAKVFFATPCPLEKGVLQKVWQKKTTVGWMCGSQQKRPCKPRGTRGGDFWRLGIALRSCPLLTYRRSLTAFFILLCMIYYYWIQFMSKHCNTWFTLSNLRFGLFYWLTHIQSNWNSICNKPLFSGCIVYENIIII